MEINLDAAIERDKRTGAKPGRVPRDRLVPHRCAVCREGGLGRYALIRTDQGLAPFIVARGLRPHVGRLSYEEFEERVYLRVKCRVCGRDEKVSMSSYRQGPIIYV